MRTVGAFIPILIASATVPGSLNAQDAVDSVFVELYHSAQGSTPGEAPVRTYRIYVDLAPGHELQMVYGDEKHQLLVHTSTTFLNDTVNGGRFAYEIDADRLNASSNSALDSWLTIGQASDAHFGVPRDLDPDGSILGCPPYPQRRGDDDNSGRSYTMTGPLCVADGLIPSPASRELMVFNLTPSYLGRIAGDLIETTNGAWAMPGGAPGVTDRNLVLIGQFTTTGDLSFRLNLQVETPTHEPVKYVARDPMPGELVAPGLEFGKYKGRAH